MTTTEAPALPRPVSTGVVEPGGIEAIPSERRHGSPWQLIATWGAPNFEFATVFVGVIAVAFFGLGFWQAMVAIVLGNALGGLAQGVLSTWGPREGLAQMVIGRTAFGYRGNILPASLNTIMAGIGWFAVNSVSGAFALTTLTGLPLLLSLVIVAVIEVGIAFMGHDLVQVFERYAAIFLAVVFIAATVVILMHGHLNTPVKGGGFSIGGFTLALGATFGYTASWNPYAADYSRYLPAGTSTRKIGWAAGLGVFLSGTILMAAGAAVATIPGFNPDSPTDSFTATMPTLLRDLTLLAIMLGAISANALNIYSGSMSFLAAGVKIPFALRRAAVALGFGIIGFLLAWSALADAGASYENFLLVLGYWLSPWLAIVLVDRYQRRGTEIASLVPDHARYRNKAGFIALAIGIVVSIALFSNQTYFVGIVPKMWSDVGDLTALVGFLLSGGIYAAITRVSPPALGAALTTAPQPPIGVDAADDIA